MVFFFVHQPMVAETEKMASVNADLGRQNDAIRKQTADLSKMQAAVDNAKKQQEAIERLRTARSSPAWLLWELSNILTRDRAPTITPEMQARIEVDKNRQFQEGWDPKKVWIDSFIEKSGKFVMTGGAQSSTDYTQLALRLDASMFFDGVVMEGASETGKGATAHYKWTLKGKVRY